MTHVFRKRIISSVPEPIQDEIKEDSVDEFVFTDSMQQCFDDADDMALFLIANGVDAAELAAFVKVSALLGKANYNKEVTSSVQKSWTKTMDENAKLSIPSSLFLDEYTKRTNIRKSVVNAFAAYLHLDRRPQMYVSTSKFQEPRGEVPEKFAEKFASYEQFTPDDTLTSQECILKSVKTNVDSYKSRGGITCVESIDVDSPKFLSTIVNAASAYQKDKGVLVSKIADPFNFVCNGIDVPKAQALEHMATKRLKSFCPDTVFYSVSDKCSQLDVENHQLCALPNSYAPYLKFRSSGLIGDVLTNHRVLELCGIDYTSNDFQMIAEKDRSYEDVVLTVSPEIRQCLSMMAEPGYFETFHGFKFGKFSATKFVPARLNRIASVSDLDKYAESFQLISLNVLSGAKKKDGRIFNSHRFYLIDPSSQTCLAVPVGYRGEFVSFIEIENDRLTASDYNSLFVTTNNVSPYAAASNELMSYLLPVLWKFYRDLSFREIMPYAIQKVLDQVGNAVHGASFDRVSNLFMSIYSDRYVFLVGSEKIDDKRVLSFFNEIKLDLMTDYVPVSRKNVKGGDHEVIKKRVSAFNFKSPNEQRRIAETLVDPVVDQLGEVDSILVDLGVPNPDDYNSDDSGSIFGSDPVDEYADYADLTDEQRAEMRRQFEEEHM